MEEVPRHIQRIVADHARAATIPLTCGPKAAKLTPARFDIAWTLNEEVRMHRLPPSGACHFIWTCLGILTVLSSLLLQAGEPAKRRPIPDKAALAKAESLVNEIFKDDIDRAKDAETLSRLASNLLAQGRDAKDEDANRYVLLREARNLAARAGDASLALAAAEETAKEFDVSSLELKAATLGQVVASTTSKEAAKTLVDITLPLLTEALEADQYETAIQLGKVAENAAKKSKILNLVTAVQKRNEEVLAVQRGFARLQVHVDRLKKNPKDPEANLELGKYYAFLKGRWEKALPLLAGGGDAALRAQAKLDLAQPKDGKAQLAVADGWWELAAKEPDPVKLHMQRRAKDWYEQALLNLTGLNRTKALKRIEAVAARSTGTTTPVPSGPVGEIKKMDGHTEEVKSVAFSVDGRHGVSGSVDQSVRVWDLATGKEEKKLTGHSKQVWAVAFHPNGRQVASASWDATARLWDYKAGIESKRFTHRLDVNGLAISRTGSHLLTGCDDHNVYLWDTSTGDEIRRFTGHTAFVYGVAFAPDSRHIASGSVDKSVRVFDLATGNVVKVFEGHTNAVTNVAFSPDSRYVFSCGDGSPRMWDMTTGKEVRKFEGHAGMVLALTLTPDGRLVTGGDDKTIRLWNPATGKELHKLNGHSDSVISVAVSADGRLLSGSMDRSVRLWRLPGR
jgi:WD40 repeat protein